jgi:hypothetical protein
MWMMEPPMTEPTLFVYVDNSNVWIEGQRISAVRQGRARDIYEATRERIVDHEWGYDFGSLYEFACPVDAQIGRSKLWGSRPPANDSLWRRARDEGFEVETFLRNQSNKEKRVDNAIAATMLEDAFMWMKPERGDIAVLVGGDGDFLPTFEVLRRRGVKTRVVFWRHATSRDLREFADEYVELDPYFDKLSRRLSTAEVKAFEGEADTTTAL